MSKKAIVVSHGLHAPWNMGEVVLAKNFAIILTSIYDDVSIFSTVDKMRGSSDIIDAQTSGFRVKLFYSEEGLKSALLSTLSNKTKVDVHFINASLIKFLDAVRKARKIYLYQFAYNISNIHSVTLRSIGALPLTFLRRITIITTSFNFHRQLSKLFRIRYYYIPAPIDTDVIINAESYRTNGQLRILYLGHASYLRFPYDKVLKALLRLHNEHHKVQLEGYVSELEYADYNKFMEGLNSLLESFNLKHIVRVQLNNLSVRDKYAIIARNDVMLYPALVGAAVDPPLVVLEAMLLGKCVIATAVQDIPYILGANRGIIINRRGLADELYKTLKMLDERPKLLDDYAAYSRYWVMKKHSIDVVREEMKKVIMC